MVARILPPDEWPRLDGTEAEGVWRDLNRDTATVVVVEDSGAIVGCHVLLPVLHAECLWIRPDYRGRSSVAKHLWRAVQHEAVSRGVRAFVTASCDAGVTRLLKHVGATKVPGEAYLVPVKG